MADLPISVLHPHGGKTILKIDTVIHTSDITGIIDLGFRRLLILHAHGKGTWTGSLSVALEGSIDNVNWYPVLDDTSTPVAIVFTADLRFVSGNSIPWRYLRLVRSAGTSGADADFLIDVYSERNN